MVPTNTTDFVFVTETSENQTCMRSNYRVQASILRVMHDSDDSFCDVKLYGVPPTGIQPDSLRPIRAHKCVLACASKHLRDLLTSEDYTDSNLSEYHIENVEHDNLRRIVEFIYTDQLMMTTEDIVDGMCRILTGAKYLVMKNLADACETFLAGDAQIKPGNCTKLWFFARKYSCLTLLHATSTFIANNLASAKEDAEFLRMPFDDCAKLLLCEAMIAANADERCLAAIAWLTHDTVGRASFVSDILNMIPLSSETITAKTIYAVHECEMLREYAPISVRKLTSSLLQELILTAPIIPCFGCGDCNKVDFQHWYLIGGQSTKRSFTKYDVEHRLWSELPALPWARQEFGACAVGNELIAVGGRKDRAVTNHINEFDCSTQTWTLRSAKLSFARKRMGVCSDGKQHAYIVGGDDLGDVDCKVVEKYNCKSVQIEKLAGFTRSGFAVALSNNRIFAAGGHGDTKQVEVYDISADNWSVVGQAKVNRWKLGGVISADDFYLAGGVAGAQAVDTVETFNIRTGQIRTARPLTHARFDCGMTTLDNGNVICVVGGFAVNQDLKTVECYDKREGRWTINVIVPNMPKGTSGFGFATV